MPNSPGGGIGVLLVQTGTPAAPTRRDVRRYLREFLSDRRVIEAPRATWLAVLHGVILPFRSGESARRYQKIWSAETGSPLLHYSRLQASALEAALGRGGSANGAGNAEGKGGATAANGAWSVRVGMCYGEPSIQGALDELISLGANRILVFPMFPQYSGASFGAALDAVWRALMKMRSVPPIRTAAPFFAHPEYIEAAAQRILAALQGRPHPDVLLISFHGIPKSYAEKGDPYPGHCQAAFEALRKRLASVEGFAADRIEMVYQSRLGRGEWLRPYADETILRLAREGKKRIAIAAPGFAADCLETLEELGLDAADRFRREGGQEFILVPALNDFPRWIESMKKIVQEETAGWTP